jgi:hypothetical protein
VWQNGAHCVGFNEHSRAGVVLFNTEWRFMLCFARAGAWKKTLLGVFLLFAGALALGNVPQLPDWTKEKVPARVENALGGSFLSVDPVLTDGNTGTSFNRYLYANNSPYRYIDPDGRQARDIESYCPVGTCTRYGGSDGNSGNPGGLEQSLQGFRPYAMAMGQAAEVVLDEYTEFMVANLVGGVIGKIGLKLTGFIGLKAVEAAPQVVAALDASGVRSVVKGAATAFGKGGQAYNVKSASKLTEIFQRITVGAENTAAKYDGAMKILPDGTRIGLRNTSKTGGQTIDIFPAAGKPYKVHIEPTP